MPLDHGTDIVAELILQPAETHTISTSARVGRRNPLHNVFVAQTTQPLARITLSVTTPRFRTEASTPTFRTSS
jgi:hypothetical protein